MVFNCKSSSSPHCDCVQSITVEKVDAFLELKIFKNNCSTMLRKPFQPTKQCDETQLLHNSWIEQFLDHTDMLHWFLVDNDMQ